MTRGERDVDKRCDASTLRGWLNIHHATSTQVTNTSWYLIHSAIAPENGVRSLSALTCVTRVRCVAG
ncbi:hypothetical protein J6590_035043 [Homalodisca vitripennis]|nr:hypothetical protein J6590_035043 [Homalodisca vitripennis]